MHFNSCSSVNNKKMLKSEQMHTGKNCDICLLIFRGRDINNLDNVSVRYL